MTDVLTLWTETTAITETEVTRLVECEAVIERGLKTFVDVGNALLEIRDSRLYRADYGTFEDYCRGKWNMQRAYAYRLIGAAEVVSNLSPIGDILPATETQARPLTSLPADQQAQAWSYAVETAPVTGITAAHVQSVVNQFKQEPAQEYQEPAKPHVSHNSGNNEWYTPTEYIEAARAVMGDIELDPASSEIANQTVKARVYFTAEDDGLRFHWDGRVWMNPPYSSELIGKFTDKLVQHFAGGDVTEAIVLVNNATETGWFQTMLVCASAVCFIKRRVKFIDMDGNPSGAPLQGQAILYMGDNPQGFTDRFSEFGVILYGNRTGGSS